MEILSSSLIFSSDGTKLFTLEVASGNDKLHQYSLTTAWDIGSMNHDGSITLQSDVYDPLGLTSDIHTPQRAWHLMMMELN